MSVKHRKQELDIIQGVIGERYYTKSRAALVILTEGKYYSHLIAGNGNLLLSSALPVIVDTIIEIAKDASAARRIAHDFAEVLVHDTEAATEREDAHGQPDPVE